MERTLSKKFPIVGYIAVWPSNRIVKVKIELCSRCVLPFVVTSLEKGVKPDDTTCQLNSDGLYFYHVAACELVNLYPSRRTAEKAELEKLHDQHLQEKIALSKQAKRVKLANKRIFEYKAFKQSQTSLV